MSIVIAMAIQRLLPSGVLVVVKNRVVAYRPYKIFFFSASNKALRPVATFFSVCCIR